MHNTKKSNECKVYTHIFHLSSKGLIDSDFERLFLIPTMGSSLTKDQDSL